MAWRSPGSKQLTVSLADIKQLPLPVFLLPLSLARSAGLAIFSLYCLVVVISIHGLLESYHTAGALGHASDYEWSRKAGPHGLDPAVLHSCDELATGH